MNHNPLVSIIVPTYNSSKNIATLLESLEKSQYDNFEIVINDDKRTSDRTPELVKEYSERGLEIVYVRENLSMAQARKKGAEFAGGSIMLHLDSDMKVSPGLLAECSYLLSEDYDALVIPEESYGTTFWAKCKWLEKKCYEGVGEMESLRAVKSGIYRLLGGHDERMIFSEDRDFHLRVRKNGYRIGRTANCIMHNEGSITLLGTARKKASYANTANYFFEAHPEEFRWQKNIFNRYAIYLKNFRYFLHYPLIYVGMIVMKTLEFAFAGSRVLKEKFNRIIPI